VTLTLAEVPQLARKRNGNYWFCSIERWIGRVEGRQGHTRMSRVLVIDDDDAVRTAIKLLLETDGYEVVAASNGHEGMRAAQSNEVDLVIVDIFMPGMDGIETIRTLRSHRPAVPIVAISGAMSGKNNETSPDFLSIATKFGAVTTLPKPFRPRELLDIARRALAPG
jgi:CheY-like chemotaxis protein